MPLYEFSCESCQQISEHLMKISDAAPGVCPLCQEKGTLRKLVSRSNFVLKGTGWYETDFKGNSEKKASTVAPNSKSTDTSSKPAAKSSPTTKSSSTASSPKT